MKNLSTLIRSLLPAILLACCTTPVSAQFTIQQKKDSAALEPLSIMQPVGLKPLEKDFFDIAAHRAEKRRIRKEQNTVEFIPTMELSMNQYENWTSKGGGSNNLLTKATVFFRYQHQKEKFNLDYRFDAKYAMTYIDDRFTKSEDEFKLNLNMGWAMYRNWSYSAQSSLKSQFSNTFNKERTKITKKFMAPGEFDVGVGFTYANPEFPLKLTISPVNGKVTTIFDQGLADGGTLGPKGEKIKGSIGPKGELFFDKTFGRRKSYRYRTNLTAYSAYKDLANIQTYWENVFIINLSKYMTATLAGKLLYDYDTTVEPEKRNGQLQYQYSLTLGITYKYKNK